MSDKKGQMAEVKYWVSYGRTIHETNMLPDWFEWIPLVPTHHIWYSSGRMELRVCNNPSMQYYII